MIVSDRFKINLSSPGVKKAMRGFSAEIARLGESVASTVRNSVPEDVPVVVKHGENRNGRPVSVVTIAHPSGLPRQAKRGVLTRAAAEHGLDIRRYAPK